MPLLANTPTRAPKDWDKDKTKDKTTRLLEQVEERQRMLYAQGKYSLLILFQGMDASGKDGAIRSVFKGINPLGIQVKAFKKPTEEELAHDFLWRVHAHAPAKGMMQIFNRSHYEDVLVPQVEFGADEAFLRQRRELINAFERLLATNGTKVLKFYLHVSRERQLERLQERVTNREKFWKHDNGDWAKAEKYLLYQKAYEQLFEECGQQSPWHIIPADQNWYKEHLIAKHLAEALDSLPLEYPALGL